MIKDLAKQSKDCYLRLIYNAKLLLMWKDYSISSLFDPLASGTLADEGRNCQEQEPHYTQL